MNGLTQDASIGTLRQMLAFKNLMRRRGAAPMGATFVGIAACILVRTIVGDVQNDEIELLTWRTVADRGPQRSRRCWTS